MHIVRFAVKGKVKFGKLEDDVVHGFKGNSFTLDGTRYKLDEVKLLVPCMPSKIV